MGDSIASIDGQEYDGPLDAVRLLSGPEGTSVEISVTRCVPGIPLDTPLITAPNPHAHKHKHTLTTINIAAIYCAEVTWALRSTLLQVGASTASPLP